MDTIYKREYRPNFTPETWVEIFKRLKELKRMTSIPLLHRKICIEVIENHRSTAELHRLAEVDKDFQWLKSKFGNPMSTRQIQNILHDYFPEYHIRKTNKKDKKNQAIRTEQMQIKKSMNEGMCHRCGATERLELHHMIPIDLGGTNDKRNLIILCHACHMDASNYYMELKRGSKQN